MTTSTLTPRSTTLRAGMGQIVVGGAGQSISSVLGSCIGLVLFHARAQVGVMAHVVLPESDGRTDSPGKFADTAVPRMVDLLKQQGGSATVAVAKLAGGASMFRASGPLQIGAANTEAVLAALAKAGIRVVAQHVGDTKGRRITLDCATGELKIEIAGCPAIIL